MLFGQAEGTSPSILKGHDDPIDPFWHDHDVLATSMFHRPWLKRVVAGPFNTIFLIKLALYYLFI